MAEHVLASSLGPPTGSTPRLAGPLLGSPLCLRAHTLGLWKVAGHHAGARRLGQGMDMLVAVVVVVGCGAVALAGVKHF